MYIPFFSKIKLMRAMLITARSEISALEDYNRRLKIENRDLAQEIKDAKQELIDRIALDSNRDAMKMAIQVSPDIVSIERMDAGRMDECTCIMIRVPSTENAGWKIEEFNYDISKRAHNELCEAFRTGNNMIITV